MVSDSVQNIWEAQVFFYNSQALDPKNLEVILDHLQVDMELYRRFRGGQQSFSLGWIRTKRLAVPRTGLLLGTDRARLLYSLGLE